jgi:dihydroxyacid dehydratase/phosphogluconate dehydratase
MLHATGLTRDDLDKAQVGIAAVHYDVSDGISMGSPGMRYSLVSREVIADSIETGGRRPGLRRLRRLRRL